MPRNQGTSRKGKPGKRERDAGMGKALQRAQGNRYRPKTNGRSQNGGGMAMQQGVESIGIDVKAMEDSKTKSVLELQDLDDFLLQADMANREFVSEKQGLVVLDSAGQIYRGPSKVQFADEKKPDFVFTELSVPRRPAWDETTTPQELQQNEKEAFLEWRRAIAHKEEELLRTQSSASVTPFEKNLEVWRQLWRVLERSACLLQLVDARNPLFYLSDDLREYAISLGKPMMVLINKSDYLSQQQRSAWRDYLVSKGWDPVFFSAALEQQKLDKAVQRKRKQEARVDVPITSNSSEDAADSDSDVGEEDDVALSVDGQGVDVPLNRQQLLDTMVKFAKQNNCEPDPRYDDRIQFGMVGFPNVGKSSVINVLMGSSKHTHGLVRVGVAAQPGKTKHFQTLLLPDSDDIMLCDCPGLVFPSFVSNTADLIAAGVYPIAQMRDHWPVVNLICQRIPREIINAQYGIQMPLLSENVMRERGLKEMPPPTGEEFLGTLCVARGMLAAASGVPDYTRAARMVIKDYAAGKLLYCHAPPEMENLQLFYDETVQTALERTEKLRDKLEKQQRKQQPNSHKEDEGSDEEDEIDDDGGDGMEEGGASGEDLDIDDDLLQMLGGTPAAKPTSPSTSAAPSRRSKKKGGRKKKNRNEDPYGCHADPDGQDVLMNQPVLKGVTVNAGKRGRKGYTRPTGYGFTHPQAAAN